jgi:hypothetical protein
MQKVEGRKQDQQRRIIPEWPCVRLHRAGPTRRGAKRWKVEGGRGGEQGRLFDRWSRDFTVQLKCLSVWSIGRCSSNMQSAQVSLSAGLWSVRAAGPTPRFEAVFTETHHLTLL